MTSPTLLNITSDFLPNVAKVIAESLVNKTDNTTQTLIIVPEKSLISSLKGAIVRETILSNTSIQMPKIIAIEGLTDDVNDMTSRNKIYAKIFELTSQHIPDEEDIASFTRSAIGEIPNLYANYITPSDILARIPANISTRNEININLFVQIWNKLNTWIHQNNITPYYELHTKILESILKSCINDGVHIFIVHDLGRSPVLRNFISKVLKTNADTRATVFFSNFQGNSNANSTFKLPSDAIQNVPQKSKNTGKKFHIQANTKEEILVVGAIQHCLNNWHESNSDSKPLIGIVCEDETLARDISLHLNKFNIPHQHNISDSIQSNSFIKLFLSIIERKPEKILPILNILPKEKNTILESIVRSHTNERVEKSILWNNILNLFPTNKISLVQIEAMFSFIEDNKMSIIRNKNTIPVFLQFKYFLLSELKQMGEQTFAKSIILHIANSWKIWEERPSSNIKICTLRNAAFHKFDYTIITSSFKIEPQGNLLFSAGLRKYYSFATPDISHKHIQMIEGTTLFTGKVPPFEAEPLLIQLPEKEQRKKYHPTSYITIKQNEMPQTLSATQVEIFFTNPLAFYYRYIKGLKEISYKEQTSLEIGNFIHKILEHTTNKILTDSQFDFTKYIHAEFKKSPFDGMKIFYIKRILEILGDVSTSKNIKISTESTDIKTQIEYNTSNITLTAKPDRIDEVRDDEELSHTIIYDYKTGSSSKYSKKTIEDLQKIQLLIPAMSLEVSLGVETHKIGKYIFLEHSNKNDFEFEITQNMIEKFREKIVEYMQKYTIDGEVLPHAKKVAEKMYGYSYPARILG